MSVQSSRMMQIVLKGRACVELYTRATVLRKEKSRSKGPMNRAQVSKILAAHWVPPMTLYQEAAL